MRQGLFVALAVACLLAAVAVPGAAAQELGSPVKLTPKGQFSLGVSGVYVFEQKLKEYDLNRKFSDGHSDASKKSGKVQDDQYYLLSLTYGLTDWANVFVQAGVVSGGKWSDHDLTSGSDWEVNMGTQFAWAVGAKARVLSLDSGFNFDVSGRYLRYDNRTADDYYCSSGGFSGSTDYDISGEVDYWQVDVYIIASRTWGAFTPYVGVGYSYGEMDYSGHWILKEDRSEYIDYDATVKNDDVFAALCGVDVSLGQGFSLYLQGTFVARTSLSLGLAWSF